MPTAGDTFVMVEHRNGAIVGPAQAQAFEWEKRSDTETRTDPMWDIVRWALFVLPGAVTP